jgi:branched-chain amino acid transport system ATP-binding protein
MKDGRGEALKISSLFAGYGRYDVVRDIDLHVAEGEAVALLGPNGAGKTTVLRAIMGLVRHRRGSIRVCGVELSTLPTHRIARGYAALVPEGRRLFLNQSVEDNLMLGALRLRHDTKRVMELVASVYELFPVLERYRSRPSGALSGGEQQMVAIGRMLMSDPHVLLLDEPSLGLAPLAVDSVGKALVELRRRGRAAAWTCSTSTARARPTACGSACWSAMGPWTRPRTRGRAVTATTTFSSTSPA